MKIPFLGSYIPAWSRNCEGDWFQKFSIGNKEKTWIWWRLDSHRGWRNCDWGSPLECYPIEIFPLSFSFCQCVPLGHLFGISIYKLEPNSCGKKKIHTQYMMLKIIKSNFLSHFFLILGFFFSISKILRELILSFSLFVYQFTKFKPPKDPCENSFFRSAVKFQHHPPFIAANWISKSHPIPVVFSIS